MKKLSFYSLLFLFPLMGVAQAQLDSGLVAHYAFCGDAADRSGNGNQGTLVGDASFGPDRNGEPDAALVLDGNGDYVDIASTSSLEQAEDQVSIALWFNTQSYFQGRWAVMLTKSDQAPLDSRQYSLYYEQNGTIYFNSDIIAVEPIPLDSWQHLAVTFSEANVMRCYLNGSLLAQDTLADTLIPNPWPVHLGRDIPGVNEFYHGSLDEVRIYDRVLDSTEIVALYTDSSD
ncbi:MAG: LamG domain-containing protein, partial [Bacteroidota bacterium]